ncbi:MAG: RNA polymerase sigma factor, partial [Ktedonobacteraceae bacterium]|nr:RNA polymerase sigma factor [Ktedonobacteraceae bacterium]
MFSPGHFQSSSPQMTDAQLAQLTLDNHQEAFEQLVRKYHMPLFNFIYRFLGDYDMACDIEQQVFLRLYTSLPHLRRGEPFKAWLFQVARNSCIDETRRQHRHAIPFSHLETEDGDDDAFSIEHIAQSSPAPDELLEHQELKSTLQQAIVSLPPNFRAVVALRYAAQLKFGEIGEVLHMPESTAKTYFTRAKVHL